MSITIAQENWQGIVDRSEKWLREPFASQEAKASALRYLGMGLYHLGRYDEARKALKASLKLDNTTFTRVMLARCEMAAGNVGAGLGHWIIAISREPWNYAEASDAAAAHGFQLVKRPTGNNTYGLRAA